MERLLDRGAVSDADLLQAVTNLSGDEFLQVNTPFVFNIVNVPLGAKLSQPVGSAYLAQTAYNLAAQASWCLFRSLRKELWQRCVEIPAVQVGF